MVVKHPGIAKVSLTGEVTAPVKIGDGQRRGRR